METEAPVAGHVCANGHSFPVVRGIPRFVPAKTYADGFGFQWHKHATTQHDQFSGVSISEERFFNETKWPRDLTGETILEVGCGSGRFTTHALSTGATVNSIDLSNAIDVNFDINGSHPNLYVCAKPTLNACRSNSRASTACSVWECCNIRQIPRPRSITSLVASDQAGH